MKKVVSALLLSLGVVSVAPVAAVTTKEVKVTLPEVKTRTSKGLTSDAVAWMKAHKGLTIALALGGVAVAFACVDGFVYKCAHVKAAKDATFNFVGAAATVVTEKTGDVFNTVRHPVDTWNGFSTTKKIVVPVAVVVTIAAIVDLCRGDESLIRAALDKVLGNDACEDCK